MARGAIVLIASDGWERGDAGLLGEQMAQLHRLAHRVVWANPHKARPGYEPLTAGMAAALPYVDDFVAGHSADALAELAEVIGAVRRPRAVTARRAHSRASATAGPATRLSGGATSGGLTSGDGTSGGWAGAPAPGRRDERSRGA
jgi:hypothetical protein